MVSSSSTTRSEIVGWMAGSKLDEMASSEHLRKPKKARINMQGSRLTFCTGCTGAPNFFS